MSTESSDDALDRSALSGVVWSTGAKWSSQIVSWASTILVARILAPSDYGLVTMASVFLGVVSMLSEFGLGTSVLTLRELHTKEMQQLNTISVLLGGAGTALTVLAAYPLGLFFRAPDLPPVAAAIGFTFFVNSLHIVPAALLRRAMRFRTLAMIDLVRGFVMPLVTLGGALLGWRYWALVAGSLVGATTAAVLTLAVRREGFAWPRLAALGSVFRFSRDVLIGRLAWTVYQNGDFAVAGRRLGQAGAGVYSIAWTLATNPIDKVTAILSDVTPSLFSAVQDDRPALRRYFLNLSELLCLATFPASLGLAMVSADLVAVLLGPQWAGAAAPLALLALYAGARSVTQLFGFLFTATRETRFAMWTAVALAGLLLLGFVVGSTWGGAGIAAAWLIVHPLLSIYSFTRIRRVLDLRASEYLRALRLGFDGAVVMGAVLFGFHALVASTWTPGLRLVVAIPLGALTYATMTWWLHRNRLRQILAWFRRVRAGGSPGDTM